MANCPKCNKHLNPLNWSAKCPHCGVNITYYDMDARLQADADKAEAEADRFAKMGENIRRMTISSPLAWARLALLLLPILTLLLPFAKGRLLGLNEANTVGISLITLIKGLISGAGSMGGYLNFSPDGKILLGSLLLLFCLVCSLGALCACVFSYSGGGRKTMMGFLWAGLVLTALSMLLLLLGGTAFAAGSIATLAAFVIGIVASKLIGDKLNAPGESKEL